MGDFLSLKTCRGAILSLQIAEISIKQGPDILTDGDSTTNLGTVKMGGAGKVKSYVITNTGGVPLKKLAITTSGANETDLTVQKLPETTIAPGASMTVKATFKPKAKGICKAARKITSNDADEKSFDIKLSGVGK